MPTLIKKENLPMVAYAPTLVNGEIVLYNPQVGDGLAAYYPATDEIRRITYKEIVEYLMTCECKPEEEPEKPKSSKPRPVSQTVSADRDRKSPA
jgi:hypothetical protein